MDILIIANFCGSMLESGNGRFVYLCKELSKKNKVELVTSNFSHAEKRNRITDTKDMDFKVTCLYEPGYKKNVSIKRFFSHYVWGKSVDQYLKTRKKPDVVYCAVPSLSAPLAASKYCRNNNIKFIIDVQDLWPEAFKMVFRIPVISQFLFFPFEIVANKIYKSADEIIAVSDSYLQRALRINSKCDSGHTVFLGTRLETFDEGAEGTALYNKKSDEVVIGYCGSLAISYDIPNLIYAVKELHRKNIKNIKLIVMGDGEYKEKYEFVAKQEKIDALFTGRLPYDQMCAQLKQCDIVVNPIKKDSAASIINKHADYAASGVPVVNSQDSKEYRELIETYSMGLNCKCENYMDMAKKLEVLIRDEAKRFAMGANARLCAEEKFDRKNSYKEIISLIVG